MNRGSLQKEVGTGLVTGLFSALLLNTVATAFQFCRRNGESQVGKGKYNQHDDQRIDRMSFNGASRDDNSYGDFNPAPGEEAADGDAQAECGVMVQTGDMSLQTREDTGGECIKVQRFMDEDDVTISFKPLQPPGNGRYWTAPEANTIASGMQD